jgi:hypothetical protein
LRLVNGEGCTAMVAEEEDEEEDVDCVVAVIV